jgi:hypothetical protein
VRHKFSDTRDMGARHIFNFFTYNFTIRIRIEDALNTHVLKEFNTMMTGFRHFKMRFAKSNNN